jgi:hypothetical protein
MGIAAGIGLRRALDIIDTRLLVVIAADRAGTQT